MNGLPGAVGRFHRLVLRAYPPEYLKTFGDEIQNTFLDGLEDAVAQGEVAWFLLREMRDAPKSLVGAYWYGWNQRILDSIELLQHITSSSDLPPAEPDGRDSWRQAFLEMSAFLTAGLFLTLATYVPFAVLHSGWQRDVQFLGNVIAPLTVPFLLLGLARGLPRWAYPLGGLLLCYSGLMTGQTGLWLFLPVMLLVSLMLFLASILTDLQPSQLPIPVRRIGQSLSLDWTRLSFGVYGAMPLVILMAFDDAHIDSRTPYFALSVLAMLACALIYCRARDTTIRIVTLLAGLSFSIWCAWLDKISFAGGLTKWVIITSSGIESILWMGVLWLQWAVFILLPVVFILLNKALHLKRAV